jgi:KDO2-lipid IV(A) lauroyltransferase
MKKFIFYLSYRLIFLLSLLPLWVLYLLSDFIFLIIFYVMKYRRRLVFKNMSDSFPNKSEEEIRVLERRFYHWFCDYLVESIKLLTISKQQLKRRMVFMSPGVSSGWTFFSM